MEGKGTTKEEMEKEQTAGCAWVPGTDSGWAQTAAQTLRSCVALRRRSNHSVPEISDTTHPTALPEREMSEHTASTSNSDWPSVRTCHR